MENNLIKTKYNNEEVVFKVENGISYVRVNEVAKFCGWTTITDGKEYPRMNRVNEKLNSLGFANVGKNDFIPESIMYPLIGMADLTKNEKARNFMTWVGQVLTEIRTTGKYDTIEHEIMKIEDEEERRLTLAVHRLQQEKCFFETFLDNSIQYIACLIIFMHYILWLKVNKFPVLYTITK